MTMKDDVRDVIGEAIQDGIDHDTFWPEVGADAALAALAEHGYVVVPRAELERVEAGIGSLLWVMNNRHNWADPRWDGLAEAAETDARAALAVVRRWKDGDQ